MAFWLMSETLIPTSTARVSVLTTTGRPYSECFAYSPSKWMGCVFMVSSVNQVLSASLKVLPGRCSYVAPSSKSSK